MATETEEIRGIGHSVKRKEDDRLIRGRGNFIDDIERPGCCTWAILRSFVRPRAIKGSTRRGPGRSPV